MCNLTVILSVFPLYTGCLDPPYTPSKNCNKIGIFIRILGKNLIFLNIKTTIWQCTSQGGPLHGPAVLYCNDYILCQVTWSHDIQQCTSCGSPHRGPTVFCCSASKLFQKKSNMEAPLQQNSIGTFEGGAGLSATYIIGQSLYQAFSQSPCCWASPPLKFVQQNYTYIVTQYV